MIRLGELSNGIRDGCATCQTKKRIVSLPHEQAAALIYVIIFHFIEVRTLVRYQSSIFILSGLNFLREKYYPHGYSFGGQRQRHLISAGDDIMMTLVQMD